MLCSRCNGRMTFSVDPYYDEPACPMCGWRDYGPALDIEREVEQRKLEPRGPYRIAPKRPRCGELTRDGRKCMNPAMNGAVHCWRHARRLHES